MVLDRPSPLCTFENLTKCITILFNSDTFLEHLAVYCTRRGLKDKQTSLNFVNLQCLVTKQFA